MDLKNLKAEDVGWIRFLVTMERERRLERGDHTDVMDRIMKRIEAAEEYTRICQGCSEQMKAQRERNKAWRAKEEVLEGAS